MQEVLTFKGSIRLTNPDLDTVNPNLNSVKKCILLTNLNSDSDLVNPALILFHLRHDVGDEC